MRYAGNTRTLCGDLRPSRAASSLPKFLRWDGKRDDRDDKIQRPCFASQSKGAEFQRLATIGTLGTENSGFL